MEKRDTYRKDYTDISPELDPDIIDFLKRSDRKMEYMETDRKRGTFQYDPETQTAEFLPSREDSLERLETEEKREFPSPDLSPEEIVLHNDELHRLRKALEMLTEEERDLVTALFKDGLSQRAYAKQIGLSQKAINKRWHKIKEKLKNFIEK